MLKFGLTRLPEQLLLVNAYLLEPHFLLSILLHLFGDSLLVGLYFTLLGVPLALIPFRSFVHSLVDVFDFVALNGD